VRIIGGNLKARRFSVPKNFPSRPTTDFAKEGLFNVLEHQLELFDLNILDLCAGTGNISFEFLSRGAGKVTAVDHHFNCIRFIRKNAEELGITDDLRVFKADILPYLERTDQTYDLIFADPPYDANFHKDIAELVFKRNLLNEDGKLIIEHGKKTDLSTLTQFEFTRTYGNVIFSFFQSKNE
jgi:16S rRNA (guanine966-N2)-methyltransferase